MRPGSHLVVVAVDCSVGHGGGERGFKITGDTAHSADCIAGVLQIERTGLDPAYPVAPVKSSVQGGGAQGQASDRYS
jgi:hypothetical protein